MVSNGTHDKTSKETAFMLLSPANLEGVKRNGMSLTKKYWVAYRRLTDSPRASQSRAEHIIGIVFFALCFLLASGLLLSMLLGESQTYINYSTNGGDYSRAVTHRPPDIVICPHRHLASKRMFQVYYDEAVVLDLNITDDQLNVITEKFRSSCGKGSKCLFIEEKCTHTPFSSLCKEVKTWVKEKMEQLRNVNETQLRLSDKKSYAKYRIAEVKALVLETMVDQGSLHMLWVAIIDPRYQDVQDKYKALKSARPVPNEHKIIQCHFYTSNGQDNFRNKKCNKNQEAFWLGSAYCSILRGSTIEETNTPYIGFSGNTGKPLRYWVGNMESTSLAEQLLVTNFWGRKGEEWEEKLGTLPLVTGVGHYSMIRWTEVAGKSLECQPQPNLRGLSLPLENCNGPSTEQAETTWFYDLKYQKRPLGTVWIYPQTMRKMKKYRSFTPYTQFQVGAGLLSCFVGFSFLQLVQFFLNFLKKIKFVTKRLFAISQIIFLLITIALTCILTSFDLYWYFGSRYTTIFNQKNENLSFPVVQLCSDRGSPYIFINTTKMAEYNASVNFYLFMRFAGWQIRPCINTAYRSNLASGDLASVEVREWMRRNWEPNVEVNITCDPKYSSHCPQASCPWFDYILGLGYSSKGRRKIESENFEKFVREIVERDIKQIAKAIGVSDPTIAQLVEFFSLDPKQFIRCSMKGQNVKNCGQFARYFLETGKHEFCVSLHVPLNESKKLTNGTELDNSFHVSYDSKAYQKHSDYNSYHGVGVESEKERDNGLHLCSGENSPSREVDRAWIRSYCPASRSWKVKIAHPEWAQNYIQIQHPRMGLIDHQLHTLNLLSGFSSMIPLKDDRCLPNDKLICRFPKEEATAVYKAIQFQIWCGCYYCAHEETGFLNHLKDIFGPISSSCCKPGQFMSCLDRYQKGLKWTNENEGYEKDAYYKIAENIMFNIKPFSNVELLRKMTPANISIWISDAELLKESEAKNLAEWTRMCFKLPCEEKSYTLLSYQNEPTEEEVVNVTIVFDSTMGVGTEEIDRLDPAQLLGILLCSYSVTIGIGVVGLLEVFAVIISKIKGSNEVKLDKTIHEHLVRGLAPITEFVIDHKIHPQSQTETKTIGISRTGHDEVGVEPSDQPAKVFEMKERNASSDSSIEAIEPAGQSIKCDHTVHPSIKAIEQLSTIQNMDVEEEQVNHVFLLISLMILMAGAIGLVLYFFSSLETEYSANIQVSPIYEKPSVAMCAESEDGAESLWRAMKKSKCWIKQGGHRKCSDLFTTYIHFNENQFCFMMDNSDSRVKLHSHTDDLIMEMPKDGPEVSLFVNGLNNTSPEDIVAFFKWKLQNISVTYNMEAYEQENSCVSEITDKLCIQCSFPEALSRPYPLECCAAKKNVSRFVPEKTCYELHFGASYVPSKAGEGDSKSLTIRASSDFLIIYKVKSKHNIPMHISISGGFISSFTEITFLNVVAVIGLWLWKTISGSVQKVENEEKTGDEKCRVKEKLEEEKIVSGGLTE